MKKIQWPLLLWLPLLITACTEPPVSYNTWQTYKGSDESLNYSSLRQVDTSNVTALKVAWTYHTGDADTVNSSQIQCNPIVIDGVLYGTSAKLKLFAIDAATGKEKWVFNPFDSVAGDKRMFFILNNSRGIRYWSDGETDKRIYYTAGSHLFAVNAVTGTRVKTFGENGRIDLHEGLGRDVADLFVTATSPPVVHDDVLVIGTRVDEGPHAAPGHIRAYDVRTGKQRWIFHTIPQPGEPGYETWEQPDAYKYSGGANAWSGLSVDHPRGIIFAVTGSASYDWYGGRRLGNNLYANSLIALDATTGKRKWHFQYIHHDVWDRDLSSPPALVSFKKNGKKIDAAVITTKTGMVFMFDRETGKPIYDIIEKPVPTGSDLAGEKLAATQPYPTAPEPFMRQAFTEKDINPLLPDSSYANVKRRLAGYKADHVFNPPSLQGTVMFPGLDGGAEWGGPSYDPETGLLYINANEMAWLITAMPVAKSEIKQQTFGTAGATLYQAHCMSCHGTEMQGSGNFPSITGVQSRYSPAQFDELLQTGRRMMPAFNHLSPARRKALAAYVLGTPGLRHAAFVDSSDTAGDDPYKLPYTITGYNKFLSSEGYPAIAPPWGTLNALDVSTGQYVWKTVLGNDKRFPQSATPTGTENYGAPVATAGGLLFIAATTDAKFRAFNKYDGRLLWETTLPAAGYATPSVYETNGKQFIVIACGGGKNGTRSGDAYVAFTLP